MTTEYSQVPTPDLARTQQVFWSLRQIPRFERAARAISVEIRNRNLSVDTQAGLLFLVLLPRTRNLLSSRQEQTPERAVTKALSGIAGVSGYHRDAVAEARRATLQLIRLRVAIPSSWPSSRSSSGSRSGDGPFTK